MKKLILALSITLAACSTLVGSFLTADLPANSRQIVERNNNTVEFVVTNSGQTVTDILVFDQPANQMLIPVTCSAGQTYFDTTSATAQIQLGDAAYWNSVTYNVVYDSGFFTCQQSYTCTVMQNAVENIDRVSIFIECL